MHILAALGAVLGVLLFVLFRMQQAANAARDIADVADDARGLFRRWAGGGSWPRIRSTPSTTPARQPPP
jgi:hypothetical protein